MFAGVLVAPRRVFHAFARGRKSRTFYGEDFEPLLDLTVRDARARYIAPVEGPRAGDAHAGDVIAFGVATLAGLGVGVAMMAVFVPLAPVGLVALWMLRRKRAREEGIL